MNPDKSYPELNWLSNTVHQQIQQQLASRLAAEVAHEWTCLIITVNYNQYYYRYATTEKLPDL